MLLTTRTLMGKSVIWFWLMCCVGVVHYVLVIIKHIVSSSGVMGLYVSIYGDLVLISCSYLTYLEICLFQFRLSAHMNGMLTISSTEIVSFS